MSNHNRYKNNNGIVIDQTTGRDVPSPAALLSKQYDELVSIDNALVFADVSAICENATGPAEAIAQMAKRVRELEAALSTCGHSQDA